MRLGVDGRTLRAVTLLAVLALTVIGGRFYDRSRPPAGPSPRPVVVEVRGDVPQPGVYLLDGPRSTVFDAIEATGLSSREIKEAVSPDILLQEVESGLRLHVERRQSGLSSVSLEAMDGAALLVLGRKLDINTASEEDLCLVSSMRPAYARAVIERRSVKPWESLDELVEITGIGPKSVEKWRDFLMVGEAR